jgi:hypothetical protein
MVAAMMICPLHVSPTNLYDYRHDAYGIGSQRLAAKLMQSRQHDLGKRRPILVDHMQGNPLV